MTIEKVTHKAIQLNAAGPNLTNQSKTLQINTYPLLYAGQNLNIPLYITRQNMTIQAKVEILPCLWHEYRLIKDNSGRNNNVQYNTKQAPAVGRVETLIQKPTRKRNISQKITSQHFHRVNDTKHNILPNLTRFYITRYNNSRCHMTKHQPRHRRGKAQVQHHTK